MAATGAPTVAMLRPSVVERPPVGIGVTVAV
jgi:hypothetical protein